MNGISIAIVVVVVVACLYVNQAHVNEYIFSYNGNTVEIHLVTKNKIGIVI